MTPAQRRLLTALYEADQGSGLLDADHENASGYVLHDLENQNLARCEGEGLWRITGGGIAALRNAKRVTPPGKAGEFYRYIEQHPGITTVRLANELRASRNTVNSTLRNLADWGLVRREGAGTKHEPYAYRVAK